MKFAELRPILFGMAGAIVFTSTAAAQIPKPPSPSTSQVTFTKDVAPILQRSCQKCHRPGSIAPMSLLTYRGRAALGARDQAARSSAREMPPWYIDRDGGHPQVQGRSVADRR